MVCFFFFRSFVPGGYISSSLFETPRESKTYRECSGSFSVGMALSLVGDYGGSESSSEESEEEVEELQTKPKVTI